MDAFRITGGKPLEGKIRISGTKNLISKLMVASTLSDQKSHFTNAPVHLGDELGRRLGRIRRGERGDGFAVAQGVLAHCGHRNFDAVMFPHTAHRLPKGNFRAEIRQHTLQPQGIAPMFDLRFPTEGTEFRAAAFDPQQLFDHFHQPKGRQPAYFF